jgi:hypothetical protein
MRSRGSFWHQISVHWKLWNFLKIVTKRASFMLLLTLWVRIAWKLWLRKSVMRKKQRLVNHYNHVVYLMNILKSRRCILWKGRILGRAHSCQMNWLYRDCNPNPGQIVGCDIIGISKKRLLCDQVRRCSFSIQAKLLTLTRYVARWDAWKHDFSFFIIDINLINSSERCRSKKRWWTTGRWLNRNWS